MAAFPATLDGMRLVPLLAIGLLAACAAEPRSTTREAPVIGGEITPQGEFPAVGALWYDGAIGCTGTLIRPDVVLTAAHCVDPINWAAVGDFTLDNDTLSAPPTIVRGDRAVKHEDFDLYAAPLPGLQEWFDIGLLFLREPVAGVTPMQMATPEETEAGFTIGLPVDIVGYGRTSNDTYDYGIKYDADANMYSWSPAEIQIGNGAPAPQNCHGDSGGPAIADFGDGPRLIGVVSRSFTQSGDCLSGGIDTRVDHYLQWVIDQIDDGCGVTCPDAGPPDAMPEPDAAGAGADGGGCSTTRGDASASLLLALALCAILRSRRLLRRR